MREQWDTFLTQHRLAATTEEIHVGGVPCRWVNAPGADGARTIIFLHGGGYQIGSTQSHHNVMARLSAASGVRVLGVNYRLAPEHRFPAPVEDALAVYRGLLEQGFEPSSLSLCGDSAGGGLAVALLTSLREASLPMPASAVLMSPWVDMEARGESFSTQAAFDPVTQHAAITLMARTYMGRGADLRAPLASPIHADLGGLPAVLVQVSDCEVLYDDAVSLVSRMQASGVEARLSLWPGMVHTFQLFAGRLDEADAALDEAARFLMKSHTKSQETFR